MKKSLSYFFNTFKIQKLKISLFFLCSNGKKWFEVRAFGSIDRESIFRSLKNPRIENIASIEEPKTAVRQVLAEVQW